MNGPCPIAIVAAGGVFPGAGDVGAFWKNIAAGVDTTRDAPLERWILSPAAARTDGVRPDGVYSTRGCFVDESSVDTSGLAIDRALLDALDPLYRIVLRAGREAAESARIPKDARQRTGVILASIALPTDGASAITRETLGRDFERRLFADCGRDSPSSSTTATHPLNGHVTALPAALLARALRLGGGSFTLDAACASSLYAIKLACDELRSGRRDAMLAGGASRPDCLYTQMGFCQLHALSRIGRCAPFDARGDGLVVGEGAGIVVLKRLEDAAAAGDEILGVIGGIGLSNDIGGSLLAPDSEGQLRAMRPAYEQAGWSPDEVDYIECHGTGTPTGDAEEVRGLRALWEGLDGEAGRCPIGSVKSMIGHLLTAAGAAGLIKVVMAMKHETLPPSLNYRDGGGLVPLAGSPFRVQASAESWRRRNAETPRRAAVSAFGFGGINAHLLVEQWRPTAQARRVDFARPGPAGSFFPDAANTDEPIAIVGMAARLGAARSLDELRRVIYAGASAKCERSPARWSGIGGMTDRGKSDPGERGAYIQRLDIEVGRYRVPPSEIPEILPQQLLMLDVVAAALADAGMPLRERRPQVGCVVGIAQDFGATNFHLRWAMPDAARRWAGALGLELTDDDLADWVQQLRDAVGPALNATRTLGALGGIVASRVAREFSFGGPSFTVSCEEASGLRALEIAVSALGRGEMNAAVVGAVDFAGDCRATQCRRGILDLFGGAGGAAGSGGDGACALVVKRLADATRDGDRVYAVVRGIGAAGGPPIWETGDSNDRARRDAVREACGSSCVDPETVMTFDALIGDTGSRLGYAGAADGLTSVVIGALCLRDKLRPKAGDPQDRDSASSPTYWAHDRHDGPRRLVVRSRTLDGNDVAAVVEECDAPRDTPAPEPGSFLHEKPAAVFAVEADEVGGLLDGLRELRHRCESYDGTIAAWARRWIRGQPRRPNARLAIAISAAGIDELQSGLATAESCIGREATAPIDGRNGVFYDPNPLRREGELAFVFPGSGNHYPGMGRRIAAHWPAVAERCASRTGFFASQFDWQSRSAEDEGIAGRPPEIQSLIFAQLSFGVLVSELLASVGVRPQRVIGYSLGESVGLFATRAWPDRDEMYRRMLASPLFHTQLAGPRTALASSWKLKAGEAAQYTAAVVARSASAVREAIADLNRVRLLIVNTPEECVIGGMAEDVGRAAQGLGCRAIRVEGVPAVHFDAARSVEDAYRDLHLFDTAPPEGVRFYSAAAAEAYDVSRQSAAESITAQAMSGFDFPALIRRAYDDGVRLFVEIGPQASCSRMIGRILEGRPHFARSASVRGVGEVRGVMDLAAALVAQRVDVDLGALLGPAEEKADPCDAPPTRAFISVAIGGPAPRPPLPPGWRSDDPAEVRHGSVDGGSQLAGTGGEVRRLATNAAPSRFDDSRVVFDFGPTARAHERFIEFCQTASEGLASVAALPARLVSAALATDPECLVEPRPLEPDRDLPSRSRTLVETPPGLKPGAGLRSPSGDSHMDGDASACGSAAAEGDIAFNKATCLEFARGQVAKVLGPRFAVVDTYPTRVRLPDEPLMLVDRIIRIEGEVASLSRGRVITEHDVVHDAWYLDGGRAPICIAVEAGQADLFLSGYLGIDLVTRGLRTYRLLDATVTFHRGLPRAGETIRYDIRIDRFVRQGETYLFFFQFDGTIDGEPVLSMRNGCAGFFTEAETRRSHGIVSGSDGDEANIGEAGACFRWPVAAREPGLFRDGANIVESYGDERLAALRNGDLAGCFGAAFAGLPVADPLRLPDGRMKLIDRVLRLAPTGGRRRLGEIVAEADVQPDDWYLLCHFVDDMVMPGTLMYECCAHALRFLLMRLGWMAGRDGARFEPLPGVASSLKCRGPVTPETKKVTYRVTIKEAGYAPHPYVIADALMSADGAAIVQMSNMSLQLSGADRRGVESIWAVAAPRNESIRPAPVSSDRPGAFTREQILAFAIGKPSDCFGPAYAVFDDGRRRVARLPGPPYQFLDRVTKLDPEPLMLAAGGWIEAEYDVSPDAWYFRANRQAAMPFAVLLEIALQPCGFLAAYCGSCLSSEADLSFRNLGGTGTVHREVMPDSGTVQTRVRMTEVAKAGGMIIEHFDFQVRRGGERVYDGSTAFGFFSREALGRQVGIRDGAARRYRLSDAERRAAAAFDLEDQPPLTPADENGGVVASAALPGRAMRMIDRIEALLLEGGPHGLGFVRGSTDVDPAAWFFAAHFYQDPVWPGSLGLESFLQLLKVYALHRYPRLAGTHRFEPIAVGRTHTWAYRGQIVPANRRVAVQAGITACEDGDRPLILASGLLTVDDTTIYEMKDFGMRLAPIRD